MKQEIFSAFENLFQGETNGRRHGSAKHFDARRPAFLAFLALATLVAMDLALWQLYRGLNFPFARQIAASAERYPDNPQPTQAEVIADLKASDRDYDGLSDYDEIYQYHTSSYLPDSDSDGKSDAEEVTAGSDPNCPEGKECGIGDPDTSLTAATTDSVFNSAVADALREVYVKTGGNSDEIKDLTDEELVEIYREAIQESDTSSDGEQVDPSQLLYFEQLGPDEIRELLVAAGLPEDLIKTYEPEQLQQMYLDALDGSDTNSDL